MQACKSTFFARTWVAGTRNRLSLIASWQVVRCRRHPSSFLLIVKISWEIVLKPLCVRVPGPSLLTQETQYLIAWKRCSSTLCTLVRRSYEMHSFRLTRRALTSTFGPGAQRTQWTLGLSLDTLTRSITCWSRYMAQCMNGDVNLGNLWGGTFAVTGVIKLKTKVATSAMVYRESPLALITTVTTLARTTPATTEVAFPVHIAECIAPAPSALQAFGVMVFAGEPLPSVQR